jgi:dGTPase
VGKDRQDAIRAGLLPEDAFDDGLGGAYNAWALSAFVSDVVENSVGRNRIAMSAEGFAEMARAKRENYEKIYGSAEVDGDFSREVREVFAAVYEQVLSDLAQGREEAPVFRHHVAYVSRWLSHYGRTYDWEDDLDLTTVDYLSSMTDDYFVDLYNRFFPDSKIKIEYTGYFD